MVTQAVELCTIKLDTMIRKMIILGALIGGMVLPSCKKSELAEQKHSVAYMKYSGEDEQITVEDIKAQWQNGNAMMIAEGYDHELLKLYLPDISRTGEIRNISEQNISFSDGLDFESTKMLDGVINITYMDEQEICGKFSVSLLDDVGGLESRGIEGSFRICRE